MIKTQVICDRCGENCSKYGTSYYMFNIYAYDINPTNDGRVCFDTAVQNLNQNMSNAFGKKKCYCKHCVTEIENFMKGL